MRAPAEAVQGLFADYQRWPEIFPMVAAVRLISMQPGTLVVMVRHRRYGEVINRLTDPGDATLVLEEEKPTHDAHFVNQFAPAPGGARVTVVMDVRLKGARSLAAAFIGPYMRHQMRRLTLEPLRRAAELEAQVDPS